MRRRATARKLCEREKTMKKRMKRRTRTSYGVTVYARRDASVVIAIGEEGVRGEARFRGVNVWNVSIASRAAIRLSATSPAATAPAATAPAATSGALRSVGKETETRVSLPSPVSIMGKKKEKRRKGRLTRLKTSFREKKSHSAPTAAVAQS